MSDLLRYSQAYFGGRRATSGVHRFVPGGRGRAFPNRPPGTKIVRGGVGGLGELAETVLAQPGVQRGGTTPAMPGYVKAAIGLGIAAFLLRTFVPYSVTHDIENWRVNRGIDRVQRQVRREKQAALKARLKAKHRR